MPVEYIERIREKYETLGYGAYQWVFSAGTPPWHPLPKPLSECRLGLVASGGIYVSGQVAFHYRDDTELLRIPMDTPTSELRSTHFAYDLTDARQDPNVVFPVDTLRGLVRERRVGSLAANAYTFMGGIYSSRRVREELAPRVTDCLLSEEVDAVLFVPA